MRPLLLFILIHIIGIVSAQTGIVNVDAIQFKKMIETKGAIILDTRSKGEFERGHIQNAQLIDLQNPEISKTLLNLPKDKPLYLYCYSGARSISVANFLRQNGYTKIYNLQRGLIDWNNNKLPLTTQSAASTTKQENSVSIAQFDKIVAENAYVLVDFYAPWCAPCVQMKPSIEKLKKEYAGKVKIIQVNTDSSKELMQRIQAPGVPYIVMYKNKKQVFSKQGLMLEDELRKTLNTYSK